MKKEKGRFWGLGVVVFIVGLITTIMVWNTMMSGGMNWQIMFFGIGGVALIGVGGILVMGLETKKEKIALLVMGLFVASMFIIAVVTGAWQLKISDSFSTDPIWQFVEKGEVPDVENWPLRKYWGEKKLELVEGEWVFKDDFSGEKIIEHPEGPAWGYAFYDTRGEKPELIAVMISTDYFEHYDENYDSREYRFPSPRYHLNSRHSLIVWIKKDYILPQTKYPVSWIKKEGEWRITLATGLLAHSPKGKRGKVKFELNDTSLYSKEQHI